MTRFDCRWCGTSAPQPVLDLGEQPPCDLFPSVVDGGPDPRWPLRMGWCRECGLAQLLEDPGIPERARGVEPAALARQAEEAVSRVAAEGWLPDRGGFLEFGSPHGGSWSLLLTHRGLTPTAPGAASDLVLDCFGMMHHPDQAAALRRRVRALAEDGVLLVQFHSLAAILRGDQWNALRHGHFAYYSTAALVTMLGQLGVVVRRAWRFDLYGGTVLLACARRGTQDDSVRALLAEEEALGVGDPRHLRALQHAVTRDVESLRSWLAEGRALGRRVVGYGAGSRAVPLLCAAGVGPDLLPFVADASVSKDGRRFPGSRVPIVAPNRLRSRRPDVVLVFLPELLPEARAALPWVEESGGRWVAVDRLPPWLPRQRADTAAAEVTRVGRNG
ncbi:methyltransferase C-terminal domain-containing protein [Actinoalloteichus caeruleus]|uniref:Zinc binding domain-containing protein n=1 Tax=Actinoalloteichus caeruleus DSM 43889 TaxID=1120930 RepID=A0ABT1JL73_ACTCY|nr:methyltransferase C-terminal domain-containing protein [Actinoalloteichus caeruleus]MCP2333264.1 putative zinc binding domain-containing protein [Actinoalloteichus caeruleus DSM 43889]